MNQPSKRTVSTVHNVETRSPATPASLTHPVSPPSKKRRLAEVEPTGGLGPPASSGKSLSPSTASTHAHVSTLRSPFQLTKIRDLPPEMNEDTISLKDILGDPLIAECWEFNYLHDIEFLMSAFDEDVRHLVKVHVVHGFWKKEDAHRLELEVGETTALVVAIARHSSTSKCCVLPVSLVDILTSIRRWHLASPTSHFAMPSCPRCLAHTIPR